MHPLQRILIIKPSSLGDVATALPLLCDLRRAYPAARIDWLVHPAFADLLHGHPCLDEVILFDRKALANWYWRPKAMQMFHGLIANLRDRHYECVIDAQGLLRSAAIARASGAQMRIGPSDAREGAVTLYTHRVVSPRASELAVVRMRALAEPLKVPPTPVQFLLPVQSAAARWADETLADCPDPVILIPGARWNNKRWPAEKFSAIVGRLADIGQNVVILGALAETPACDAAAYRHKNALNLAGRTSLAQMVALLARARAVVSNDTGPLHVAVALGRPVVGVYGPTNPASVGPFGQLDHVVRFEAAPEPRGAAGDASAAHTNPSDVEQVWTMLRRIANF